MLVFSTISLIFASLLFMFLIINTVDNWSKRRTEDLANDIWSLILYGVFFTTALMLFMKVLNII